MLSAMMRLFGTPLSHFTRKVRILFEEIGAPYEMVFTKSVLAEGGEAYADNPLMRVPTLVDGDVSLFESEHIARYVVTRSDPNDRLRVRSEDPDDMNLLAVTSGIMADEVTVLLARRAESSPGEDFAYVKKRLRAMNAGLSWIDERVEGRGPDFDWRDVALVSLWQHLEHYALVADLARFSRFASRVARFANRASVVETAPARSLEVARSRGWTPG